MTDLASKLAARRHKVDEAGEDGYFTEGYDETKSLKDKDAPEGRRNKPFSNSFCYS